MYEYHHPLRGVDSSFVSGHVSTMWFMVCHWPQSQEGDWTRPHLCMLAQSSSEKTLDSGNSNLLALIDYEGINHSSVITDSADVMSHYTVVCRK